MIDQDAHAYDESVFNKVMTSCHLQYIDISNIKPTNQFIWISFMGDSLLRSPFLLLSSQLTHFSIDSDNILDNSIEEANLYKLGPRFHYTESKKERYEEWSASETMKLHLDHVICCPVDVHSNQSCTIGIKDHDYNLPTANYVYEQIHQEFNHSAVCLSWHFTPVLINLIDMLNTTFYNGKYNQSISALDATTKSSEEVQLIPQSIIMNVGLHEVWNSGKVLEYKISKSETQLYILKDIIEDIYNNFGVIILYHKPLPMVQDKRPFNPLIKMYNKLLDKILVNASSLNHHILDIYEYAQNFHVDKYCIKGDGIHFTRKCVYAKFVTQWDLNLLKVSGLFV